MIYLIVSRSSEVGDKVRVDAETPLIIKIPKTNEEEHPIIGFESLALAQLFLERRNIPGSDYKFVLKGIGLSEKFDNKRIFLIENESQLEEIEKDPEGYDYEKNIHGDAL